MFGLFLNFSVSQQYLFNRFGRELFASRLDDHGPFNFCISTQVLNEYIGNDTQHNQKAGDVAETKTAGINLVASLLGQLPAIFAALLYGPISDRTGRKPAMLIMASASAVTGLLLVLMVHYNWSVYWILPLSVINSLAGGIPGLLTLVYSYIADISSHKWLTARLGIVEAVIFFGITLSLVTGGQWLETTNCKFEGLYILYTVVNLVLILYIVFFLPESLTAEQRRVKRMKHNRSSFHQVTRGMKIFFTKNEYSRWRLWFAILIVFLTYMVFTGGDEISTLFLLHKPLSWSPGTIGIYQAVNQLIHGITVFAVIPILVMLKCPDSLIVVVGILWGSTVDFLTGWVRKDWHMWTIGAFQGMEAIGAPPLRSIISKSVSSSDQGAAFSLLATVQVLGSGVASVVFFFFYPLTLYLGLQSTTTFFLLTFFFIIQLPFAIMLFLLRKRPGAAYHDKIKDEDEEGSRDSIPTTEEEEGEETEALLKGESPPSYRSHEQQQAFGEEKGQPPLVAAIPPEDLNL